MITVNLFRRLKQLIPDDPVQIGEVVGADAYGAMVQYPSGDLQRVRGVATLGQKVFVRGGAIEGPAPDLDVVEIDI